MAFKSGDTGHLAEHNRIAATLTAQDVRDSTSAASASLAATYLRLSAAGGAGGARYVALGDSISIAGDVISGTHQTRLDSFPAYFAAFSGGKVLFVRNSGIGGNKTSDMIARFDTDVTPYSPTIVTLQAGTNDFTFGVTNATFRANIATLVGKIQAIGAKPVLLTMPPVNTAGGAQKLQIVQNNTWLAFYGAANNIPVVDMYGVVTDPATGNYLASMDNGDGTHPSPLGRYQIGQAVANLVGPMLSTMPMLTRSNVDPSNELSNGLMLNSTSGVATGWSVNGTPTTGTATNSIVTDTAVPGNMQRITMNAATGYAGLQFPITVGTNINVGDVLRFSAKVTSTSGIRVEMDVQNNLGTNQLNLIQLTEPLTRATLTVPDFTVPSTGTVDIDISAHDVNGAVTGTADFGQLTLTNLTTGALLAL